MSTSFLADLLLKKTMESLEIFSQRYHKIEIYQQEEKNFWSHQKTIVHTASQGQETHPNTDLSVLLHYKDFQISQAILKDWPFHNSQSDTLITGLLLRYDQVSEDYWSSLSELLIKSGLKHLVVEHQPFQISYKNENNFHTDLKFFHHFKPMITFKPGIIIDLTFIKLYAQGYEKTSNITLKIKNP